MRRQRIRFVVEAVKSLKSVLQNEALTNIVCNFKEK